MKPQHHYSRAVRIVFRDCNGKRSELVFDDGIVDPSALDANITDDTEILFVYVGDQIVWCGLTADTSLTIDDLTGFFA